VRAQPASDSPRAILVDRSQPNCLLVRLLNAYSSYIIVLSVKPLVAQRFNSSEIIVTYGKAYALPCYDQPSLKMIDLNS
jgi:hypothetical protein